MNLCFNIFQIHGFTCRVYHLIILKDMDLERTKQLQKCEVVCQKKYSIRPLALMSMRR